MRSRHCKSLRETDTRNPCHSLGVALFLPGEGYSWPQAAALFFSTIRPLELNTGCVRVKSGISALSTTEYARAADQTRYNCFVRRDLSHRGRILSEIYLRPLSTRSNRFRGLPVEQIDPLELSKAEAIFDDSNVWHGSHA